jgi:hypothetical protein
MTLPGNITTITLTGTFVDLEGDPAAGTVWLTPSSPLYDLAGTCILTAEPIIVTLDSSGSFSQVLPCTNNTSVRPNPFYYLCTISVPYATQTAVTFYLPSTLGSTVDISALVPIPSQAAAVNGIYVSQVNGQSGSVTLDYLPQPSGTPTAGQVPVATGTGQASAWGSTSGGVDTVTAADASITIAGTANNPTVTTGTLTQIAAAHPPAGAVAMNGQKLTGLANGTATGDSVAYGQLGTAAFQATSAFDTAGAAATAQSNAETYAAAQATAAQTAAEAASVPVGDLPLSIGNGGTGQTAAAAGLNALGGAAVAGDLGNTSASPQVVSTHLSSPLPLAQGGTGQTGAAAAYTALSPMTTKGDIEYESVAGTASRLALGTVGQSLQVAAAGIPAWQASFIQLATTGTTGYTLVNGTGTIVSWPVPNDGNLHRITVLINLLVTSGETAGAVALTVVTPSGVSHSPVLLAGGAGTGLTQITNSYFAEAGSTVTLAQSSALTGGAATLWAEIWGS